MARYGKAASESVRKAMHKEKRGKLRSASATLVAFRSWLPLLQRINHAHITIALAVCQVFGIEHFGSAALCRLHDERIPE